MSVASFAASRSAKIHNTAVLLSQVTCFVGIDGDNERGLGKARVTAPLDLLAQTSQRIRRAGKVVHTTMSLAFVRFRYRIVGFSHVMRIRGYRYHPFIESGQHVILHSGLPVPPILKRLQPDRAAGLGGLKHT